MFKIKNNAGHKLCNAKSIPEGEARGFTIKGLESGQGIFIVNKDGQMHGYINRCPHAGTPLDWSPDQFLNKDSTYIQCSTHGAIFQIQDGLCIQGPCINQSLTKIELELKEGDVYWLKV